MGRPMVTAVLLLAIAFLLALLVWVHAGRRIARSGVPEGRVISQDADRRRALHRPLVSLRYGPAKQNLTTWLRQLRDWQSLWNSNPAIPPDLAHTPATPRS